MKITSLLDAVDTRVPDASTELPDFVRYHQVRLAVLELGCDRPDETTETETGTGSRYYPLSNLANWSNGFSQIIGVEYPAADVGADETPNYLDPDDYQAEFIVDGTRYLRFIGVVPESGEAFRVRYTHLYHWSASTETVTVTQVGHGFTVGDEVYYDGMEWKRAEGEMGTHIVTAVPDSITFTAAVLEVNIPSDLLPAVIAKGACLVCRAIAAKYGFIGDSTIGADAGAHTTKAGEFARRAEELCKEYRELMGLEQGGPAPSGGFVQWRIKPSWGERYAYHRLRR